MLVRTIQTPTHGRYLVRPSKQAEPAPLVVGFHGYAQHAQAMLDDLERVPGAEGWTLVSVQGLHRFYNTRTGDVVASWMTKEDRELAIADNIAYAAAVVQEVSRGHPPSRVAFVGFSQGVATAFRAAARAGIGVHAVVALGGDIPPELRDGGNVDLPPVLIGRGDRDEYYTAAKLAVDAGWLSAKGLEHETLTFEGGHEWTAAFRQAAGEFLGRRLRRS
jgi:predicted esterase